MKQAMLSESSSSDEEQDFDTFTINQHYAKAYEYRKEREELAKLKEKYGSDAESGDDDYSDSESDESEDEDGEELTPAVDAAILRTLARIKHKDPEIYDAKKEVFNEEHQKSGKLPAAGSAKKKTKEGKPITMHEHRIAAALEGSRSASPEPADGPTHVEEQERLRKETIAAFHASKDNEGEEEEEEEEEEGGLFRLREKTQDEIEKEEEEYRRYLEREVDGLEGLIEVDEDVDGIRVKDEEADGDMKNGKADKKKKKSKKEKGKEKGTLDESDQQFLMNYMLNRGWIDRSAKRLPTFEEITAGAGTSRSKKTKKGETIKKEDEEEDDDDKKDGSSDNGNEENLDEDEFDEVAERFESSYNFRFEEPNAPHIPSFPRQIETVRRPAEHADRRKEARERRKERKEEEKRLKKEEVRRLKGLKMRELNKKLELVSKEGGWANAKALENLDLEGDWDPDAYDRQMAAVLDEVDGALEVEIVDDEKPTWDDDIDVADIVPPSEDEEQQASSSKSKKKDKKKKEKKKKAEEEDGVDIDMMDADAEQVWGEDEWDGTEEMRKKVLDKYMDEIYGLDFNDMAAGMPTRFRYVPVPKTSYGLSAVDILMADDRDLNEYVGLKKYAPYRKEKDRWDAKRPEKLQEFKQKLTARGVDTHVDGQGEEERKEKKRKGKKERMKAKAAQVTTGEAEEMGEEAAVKSLKRSREDPVQEDNESERNGDTKKKRRRHKKSGHGDTAAEVEA
ncbi:KRI1-like family C-terminal-domain-containing protein [Amylostereum chailletii]|nr:KRI1-like family C-terminal-domain-containing protein [Amylostereum chailletii]